jgi:hypothetical protein
LEKVGSYQGWMCRFISLLQIDFHTKCMCECTVCVRMRMCMCGYICLMCHVIANDTFSLRIANTHIYPHSSDKSFIRTHSSQPSSQHGGGLVCGSLCLHALLSSKNVTVTLSSYIPRWIWVCL